LPAKKSDNASQTIIALAELIGASFADNRPFCDAHHALAAPPRMTAAPTRSTIARKDRRSDRHAPT
jgi:hypothetical protein